VPLLLEGLAMWNGAARQIHLLGSDLGFDLHLPHIALATRPMDDGWEPTLVNPNDRKGKTAALRRRDKGKAPVREETYESEDSMHDDSDSRRDPDDDMDMGEGGGEGSMVV
jgi:hypothetical protein